MPFFTHLYESKFPTYSQKRTLDQLRTKLSTKYDDAIHYNLLKGVYETTKARRASAHALRFEISGTSWRYLGFSQEQPELDLRLTGILGLECLSYLVTHYGKTFLSLIEQRSRNNDFDNRHYPFAIIVHRIVLMIASMFDIYDPVSNEVLLAESYNLKSYWHFISAKEGFYRLCASAVLLYEMAWEEHYREEFALNGYNFRFGITEDWSLMVWPFHDVLLEIFNHSKDVDELETFALHLYHQSLLGDDDVELDGGSVSDDDSIAFLTAVQRSTAAGSSGNSVS